MPDNRLQLQEPIFAGGIKSANYFNGRLLTAEDLKTEQEAQRLAHQQVARASGVGVVDGLEVERLSDGSVKVTPGLAFNALGEAVALTSGSWLEVVVAPQSQGKGTASGTTASATAASAQNAMVLSGAHTGLSLPGKIGNGGKLIGDGKTPSQRVGGTFAACKNPVLATGTGTYLLVASPAAGYQDRVAMTAASAGGQVTGCGDRYQVEGLQFTVLPLSLTETAAVTDKTRRNWLAHQCYGTADLAAANQQPFEPQPAGYGLLDELRTAANQLTTSDVPLALIYVKGGKIDFVDTWAVRRRLVRQVAAPGPAGATLLGERRLAEAEAMYQQFQAQARQLASDQSSSAAKVNAREYFCYLPAAGLLPIGDGGFDPTVFFADFTQITRELDPAFVQQQLVESWLVEPMDLQDKQSLPPVLIYAREGVKYVLFYRARQGQGRPAQAQPTTAPTEVKTVEVAQNTVAPATNTMAQTDSESPVSTQVTGKGTTTRKPTT